MLWILIALAVFVLIVAAMYVPDWIRWVRWNSRRKRLSEHKAKKLRPPVAPPFWSSYAGPVGYPDSDSDAGSNADGGPEGDSGDGDGCA
jgi:hypothetical protein